MNNEVNTLSIKKIETFICADCGSQREQMLKSVMPDNILLYQCEKCGCENTLEAPIITE
jgi:uncharacterized Zn finger protein